MSWTNPPPGIEAIKAEEKDLAQAIAEAFKDDSATRAGKALMRKMQGTLYPADRPWEGLHKMHADALNTAILEFLAHALPDGIRGSFTLMVSTIRDGDSEMTTDTLSTMPPEGWEDQMLEVLTSRGRVRKRGKR